MNYFIVAVAVTSGQVFSPDTRVNCYTTEGCISGSVIGLTSLGECCLQQANGLAFKGHGKGCFRCIGTVHRAREAALSS